MSQSPTTALTDSVPHPGDVNVVVITSTVVAVVVVLAVVTGFLIAGK